MNKIGIALKIDDVRSMFAYDDGSLVRLTKTSGTKGNIGDIAGYVRSDGYRSVHVSGRRRLEHRVIFFYHHGYLPEFLDHIDGDHTNNRIENLREATKKQNCFNAKLSKASESGVKGVGWDRWAKAWRARVMVNGKSVFLGNFWDKWTAELAAKSARLRLHKEFSSNGVR